MAVPTRKALSAVTRGLESTRLTGSKGQKYFFQREIGHGAFAVVYRCMEENTPERRRFACKVISKRLLNAQAQLNLMHEISILHSVQHENLLHMEDLLETPDYLFIMMPYMDGGELFEKVASRGRFSEGDARDILLQIARGLEYLHAHGICHRDIKPENILCSGDDEHPHVVISDFGLSKAYGRGELMTTSCGTLHYAAPEVIQHAGAYTEACDMWSYGVVAYVLLCGCFPFVEAKGRHADLIVRGMYNQENLILRGVSQAARDFIARLLRVNPLERPTAANLVANDPWLNTVEAPQVDLTASANMLTSLMDDFDDYDGEPYVDDAQFPL